MKKEEKYLLKILYLYKKVMFFYKIENKNRKSQLI